MYRLLAALVLGLCTAASAQSQSIAIRAVTVVDVTDGTLHPNQIVLVEGHRITAIGPAADVTIPEEAEIVEAEGRYLIPGMWDMHVHGTWPFWIESFYPLFLAHGVTGIRDTWGSREAAAAAEAAIEAGEMAGPVRAVVAGNMVDGSDPVWPGSQVAATPEDGRRIVDSLHAAGAPFVKVYERLSPETFRAIAERAHELGIPFAGHVPVQIRAAEASDVGQRSVEHLKGVLIGCSSEEAEIIAMRKTRRDALAAGDSTETGKHFWMRRVRHMLDTQSTTHCTALLQRFIANETWHVPTLTMIRGYTNMLEFAAAGDERLRYLPLSVYSVWFPETNRFAKNSSEESWALGRTLEDREHRVVGMMANAGVPLLAGTDTPLPWAFPGSGLHDELALFVEAGLTPLQALQTATLNPARFFGRTNELGTVDVGKLADLVLLDANPLDHIENVRQIRAVIADGRLYRRADLDNILAALEAENSRTSVATLVAETLKADGAEAARERFRAFLNAPPDSIRFGDEELIGLGYQLLGEERVDDAIAVFEMNIAAYPSVPNPYDSYADGLVAAGRIENARDALVRAVQIAEDSDDFNLSFFRSHLAQITAQLAEQD